MTTGGAGLDAADHPSIDVHAHFMPREWPDLEARYGTGDFPWLRDLCGRQTLMVGTQDFRRIDARSWDAGRRLEDMDRCGVGTQVLSPTPILLGYHRRPEAALDVARVCNESAREIAAAGPAGRFETLAQVPLQDVELACAEVDRAMSDGHLGVMIGNHVGEDYLDAEPLVTFLSHCAAAGAAVFVHPHDMHEHAAMRRWAGSAVIGMVAETHLTIFSLILSGAFDRISPSLRICFAHGGGSFPFWLGRLHQAWTGLGVMAAECERPPAEYVDRFFVDTAVFSEAALSLLVEVMGEDRVVVGSDYPFPLGEDCAGALVRSHRGFAEDTRTKILRQNAQQLLGITASIPS